MPGHEVQQEAYGELSDLGRVTWLILFAFLEAACIPISSEITFGFAGVLAYQGHLNLALVIILGTLAELGGSYASYAVGRIGGPPLVTKLGRYVLVTEFDVSLGRALPRGPGDVGHPGGRMLPVRPRLHLDRRRPGARPGGQVRDLEPDRHGPLRGRALLDRLRARQHLAKRQPRPRGRRLRAVRPGGAGHRRLHRLPLARGPGREDQLKRAAAAAAPGQPDAPAPAPAPPGPAPGPGPNPGPGPGPGQPGASGPGPRPGERPGRTRTGPASQRPRSASS